MRIARQSVVTNWQAQALLRSACAAAGMDESIALTRPLLTPPLEFTDLHHRDWHRREHNRRYWRLVRARCILAYHIRNTTLPDGSTPSYPIVATCLRLRSHSQAMFMVEVGRVHVIRAAWPRWSPEP